MSMMELPDSAVASAVTHTVRKTRRKKPVTIDEAIPSLSVDQNKQYYAVEYVGGDVSIYEYTGHNAYRETAESSSTRLIVGPFSAVDLTEAENIGCSLLTSLDDLSYSIVELEFYNYCMHGLNHYDGFNVKQYIFEAFCKTRHVSTADVQMLRSQYPCEFALVQNMMMYNLKHRKFMMKMQKALARNP